MRPQRVLFIGGSGIISSACSRAGGRARHRPVPCSTAAQHATRPLPAGVTVLRGDIRDPASVREALGDLRVRRRRRLASRSRPSTSGPTSTCSAGRTGQYVFISSASAYQTPPARLPVDGVDAAAQPVLAVLPRQDRLRGPARRARTATTGFPMTIVRPSHTYDRDARAVRRRLDRCRTGCAQGKPVVVHGDGTSLWTLTHHDDFARGLRPAARAPARRSARRSTSPPTTC